MTVSPLLLDKRFWLLLGLLALAAAISLPNLPFPMAASAILSVFCVTLWATGLVPPHWTALCFFTVAVLLNLAPTQTIFSGFTTSTFWLLFSGVVLGAAIQFTGLGKRAAYFMSKGMGDNYQGNIARIVLFGILLAFLMPAAIGRIVLIIPLANALADEMGYSDNSTARQGMVAAGAIGTFLPAFTILSSNLPNMMLGGMSESLYGLTITYWEYVSLHFPILGLLKAGFLILIIARLFPDDPMGRQTQSNNIPLPTLSLSEKFLCLILVACLLLWLSDSLHHISAGWIGLGASVICLFPASRLTGPDTMKEKVDYPTLIFIAGILGLGAVVAHNGVGAEVVNSLSQQITFDQTAEKLNMAILAGLSILIAIITNLPGVPAIMTPMAENMSQLTGIPLKNVLMTQIWGFSNVFLPYQAAPLLMAIQLGKLPIGKISQLCLILFFIGIFILLPLEYFWWKLLGVL